MNRFGSNNRRDGVTSRLRLREFDYTSPGYYFVTICCHGRARYFGDVYDGQIVLSPAGQMVHDIWNSLPTSLAGITVDSHVTMPNHVHAVIGIGVQLSDPEVRSSLSEVIHWYKSITTTRMIQGVRQSRWPKFDQHLWQSGFHDRIVRSERELDAFRHYIATNPERWDEDTFYIDS